MTKLFISYARKDKEEIQPLVRDLRDLGFTVWIDISGIKGGAKWSTEIVKAITECDFFLLFISSASIESDSVSREVDLAYRNKKKIIPLKLEKVNIPPEWDYQTTGIQQIDCSESNWESRLLVALGEDETKTRTKLIWSNSLPATIVVSVLIIAVIIGFLTRHKGGGADEATQTAEARLTGIAVTTQAFLSQITDTPPPSFTPSLTPTFTPSPTSTPVVISGMVFIPASEFIMGSNDEKENEKPEHTVTLDAYYIDKYEVTNALYRTCVEAGVCNHPKDKDGFKSTDPNSSITDYFSTSKYDNYPVVYVDWSMAQTYCEWSGGRLPTEAEWEKAARGTKGLRYPWGNDFLPVANYCDTSCEQDWHDTKFNDGYKFTSPVGNYPKGASPYGVMDMAGNVWEWVADWRSENYQTPTLLTPSAGATKKVIKGGSWFNAQDQVYASNRGGYDPDTPASIIGFRCARDAQP